MSADLSPGTQDAVSQQWLAVVNRAPTSAKVSEFYAGRGVRRMQRLAESLNVASYVVSAGLGLLAASTHIPNYDLSVSPGAPSAIQRRIRGRFSAQDWWKAVQKSPFAQPLSQLFTGHSSGLVLIAVSKPYVPLLLGDLSELSSAQRARLRLFGSADSKYPAELRSHLMPYDSRLDALVPGSKVDFAQRAAQHFIVGASSSKAFPALIDKQRAWVEAHLRPVTPKAFQKREAVDDTRIRHIAKGLAGQGLSYTSALNTLRRRHGIACEQRRFRRLFLEASA